MKSKGLPKYINSILIMIVFFILYYSISHTEVVMTSNVFEDGEKVHEDTFKVATATSYTQSLFSLGEGGELYFLQSTKQITEPESVAVIRIRVDNKFGQNAQLLKVEATSDGAKVFEKIINMPINSGSYYTFTSAPLDLEGKDSQLNIINFDFIFKVGSEQKTQTYKYAYYSLTSCTKDSDCNQPNILCDLGNLARFSTSKDEFYCVRPCDKNADCYTGQVCIKGACGY